MSRFGNLEFDAEPRSESAPRLERDEGYWLETARESFQRAEFESALRSYARVLEYNPKNVQAWTGQVRVLIELGEYEEAKVWANKALEQFPTAPELLASKAVALGRLGDHENALAFSDASVEERGDSAYIWLARGDVLLGHRASKADYCLERAISMAPGDWVMAWLVARVRMYYRQFAAALRVIQTAVELAPGEFVVWVTCGECQTALGLPDRARISFTQAIQLNRDCAAAHQALRALSERGLMARVFGWFRERFH